MQAEPHVNPVRPGATALPTHPVRSKIIATINSANPIQALLTAFEGAGDGARGDIEWQRKLAREELYAIPNAETPYGRVCVNSTVPGKTGNVDFYHVNPFAVFVLGL